MTLVPKGLPADTPLFDNHYDCLCGEHWEDRWDSGCDDECPSCGTTCSPSESVEVVRS